MGQDTFPAAGTRSDDPATAAPMAPASWDSLKMVTGAARAASSSRMKPAF